MQKIAAFVSKTTLDWLIPINELKTLDTGICDILNVQRMTHQDDLAGDLMYAWSEGMAETRKHCVAPLVHVLVSERLSHAVLSNRNEDKPLPAVFIMPSTPRSMDWVIVLHLFAYKRPQEFAFTESRGLLKLNQENPVYKHWASEKVSHEWLGDTVAPNYCYGLFPAAPRPAPLGVDKDLTVEVARSGMICREFWADWMAVYKAGKGFAELAGAMSEVAQAIQKERLFVVPPSATDELRGQVVAGTGLNLFEAMNVARAKGLTISFTQTGDLRQLANSNGDLLSLEQGVGKDILDIVEDAKRQDKVKSTLATTLPAGYDRHCMIHPVGSELRQEQAELKANIVNLRPQPGYADIPTIVRWGRSESLHYPPYCSFIRDILGKQANLTDWAEAEGLILITLTEDFTQLTGITGNGGDEISPARGMSSDIAKAFGGVIGQPVRK